MSEAHDKIEELRNTIQNISPEDARWLDDLEKDIKKRERYADFLEHPVTKEIVERVISWIQSANDILLSGKGTEKTTLQRDNLLDILSIFSPTKAKTDHIVKQLDPKIKEFKDYYANR